MTAARLLTATLSQRKAPAIGRGLIRLSERNRRYQATVNEVFCFWLRYATNPKPRRPISIMVHVAGNGVVGIEPVLATVPVPPPVPRRSAAKKAPLLLSTKSLMVMPLASTTDKSSGPGVPFEAPLPPLISIPFVNVPNGVPGWAPEAGENVPGLPFVLVTLTVAPDSAEARLKRNGGSGPPVLTNNTPEVSTTEISTSSSPF